MADSEKFDLILSKLENIELKLAKQDSKFENIESKLAKQDSKFENMESKFESMGNDVKTVKLILENEIRVNIQRVTEGHLDLSRNLHNAMKPSNEIEMLMIKVNTLESEVKELKRRIS